MTNNLKNVSNKSKHSSLFKRNLKKFFNNKLAVIGLIITFVILFMCIFAPLFTKFDPTQINLKQISLKPLQEGHLLGTDKQGRDLFARILYGGRVSIFIGLLASFVGSLIGVVLGGIAGYVGGFIDSVLVKLSEILSTFPSLIIILVLVSIVGNGVGNIIFIFSLTGWMTTFRLVRTEFLTLKEETYVQVSKAFGMSDLKIMFTEILPNAFSPVLVATTINVAGFILSEAGLSFIGVGVPNSVPTWGTIINVARNVDVITGAWWLWVFPGATISLFILGINFLGDGLRDVLDPKQL